LAWPEVSVRPHRFAAWEFRFCQAEVGHVHEWGDVDIPFPRALRDELVEEGLTGEHRHVPASGWTTFHVGTASDLDDAVRLMRLSYLRYALKSADDAEALLRSEAARLGLSTRVTALLEQFVPARV